MGLGHRVAAVSICCVALDAPHPNRKGCPCCGAARPSRDVKCHGDPVAMQNAIVFGSVLTAAGLAVFNGLKSNETQMCDLCKGYGTFRGPCSVRRLISTSS